MPGADMRRQRAVRRVASNTGLQVARIWDRSPMRGPFCVKRLKSPPRWSAYERENRLRITRLRGMDFDQCACPAVISVDGQPYCERHAGEIALAALLGEE